MSELGRNFWDGVVKMTPAAQKHHSLNSITIPYESAHYDITLFVYCHNDADTILETLETIKEAMEVVEKRYEIVLVDDASSDHTADLLRSYMSEFPRIPMVLRINKQHKGLAVNYTDAAFIGTGKYFRLIFADNSEPVETMVDVLRAVGDADIVVPYYISMHNKSGEGGLFSSLLNLVGGHNINYYGAVHVHLRYNVMRWQADTLGPFFQVDLLCRLMEQGFTMKQVPCRAVPLHYEKESGWRRFGSAAHVLVDMLFRRFSGRWD